MIKAGTQLIHCRIEEIGVDLNFYLSVVYDYNTGDKKKELWTNLRDLAIGMTTLWLICGDFNALLYPQDKLYGNPVHPTEIAYFSNCSHDLSLNELSWKGEYYIWTNNQNDSDRIYSRIDRVLGNFEWIIQWDHLVVNYGLPNISEHTHIVINMTTQSSTKLPFRFFNVRANHSSFLPLVEKE
ncbi:hypothetical protein KY290_001360 [Solanum tuberosum]|uniref:Reverse transcriptase n=1 Tax=Solanum tuberosum TaxID=4113 RepID=A0ABQ7WLX2_SOLTU|nr:hypothetical protein KY290_001360 [Solanum tuberosum]